MSINLNINQSCPIKWGIYSDDEDEDESVNTEVEISIPLPSEQANFSAIIDSMYNVYQEQPNDLKKSSVKKARNSLFEEIKFNRKVTNWIGKLTDMSTNDNGNASIGISLLGSRAEVETAGHPITLGTNLYNDISSLSTGDTVVVCGSFYPSPDYMGKYEFEYIYESSVTEYGSMSNFHISTFSIYDLQLNSQSTPPYNSPTIPVFFM